MPTRAFYAETSLRTAATGSVGAISLRHCRRRALLHLPCFRPAALSATVHHHRVDWRLLGRTAQRDPLTTELAEFSDFAISFPPAKMASSCTLAPPTRRSSPKKNRPTVASGLIALLDK